MNVQKNAQLRRALLLSVSTTGLLLAAASPAFAQEAEASKGVEQIVVTAQRTPQLLKDVPVAVSVVSAGDLARNQVYGSESLVKLVPSLTFRKGTTNVNSAINIRGIGTISFSSGTEPSVSMVVDGVVYARSGQAFFEFLDVSRIEVLRGPQGTLFGKNASGGVVSVTTKRPAAQLGAKLEASYFDGNELRLSATVEGPTSENTRGSLTLVRGSYDGNITNVFNNTKVNGYDNVGIRGKYEWTPTEKFSLTLIADYVNAASNCCADVIGKVIPGAFNTNILIPSLAPSVPREPNFQIDNDLQPATKDKNWGVSATGEWDLGFGTLTAITAYRGWGNTEVRDGDFRSDAPKYVGNGDNLLHDYGTLDFNQFTQEVRLSSNNDNPLTYTVGGYYYKTNQDNVFTRTVVSCTASAAPADPVTGLRLCPNGISQFQRFVGTATFSTELRNYSLFGQANYKVTDKFSVLGGLRYSNDEVKYNFNRVSTSLTAAPGIQPAFASINSTSTDNLSGKVGASYAFTPAVSGYATYARGYKGPAFNVFFNMTTPATLPISEETSDAYEIGLKTELFDRRLIANIAAFDTKFDGFQTTSFDVVAGVIVSRLTNAGKVGTKGIELDFIAVPVDGLRINGGFSSIDAKIINFFCPVGSPASCSAVNGRTLPIAPKTKWSLGVDYVLPLGESFPLKTSVNTSYAWQSEVQFDINQSPDAIQESYGIWDAGITFADKDDRYSVSIIGKNLTDEFFTTLKVPGSFIRLQVPRDAQRYFGISAKAKF